MFIFKSVESTALPHFLLSAKEKKIKNEIYEVRKVISEKIKEEIKQVEQFGTKTNNFSELYVK